MITLEAFHDTFKRFENENYFKLSYCLLAAPEFIFIRDKLYSYKLEAYFSFMYSGIKICYGGQDFEKLVFQGNKTNEFVKFDILTDEEYIIKNIIE